MLLVEAVRRAPLEGRGLAMGAFTACLDLALGRQPGAGPDRGRRRPECLFLAGMPIERAPGLPTRETCNPSRSR
jgi:hypothetical protein